MLPIDFSIVGTVHSHPSGDLAPSTEDCNHFFGSILMIVGFPFAGEANAAVYGSGAARLPLRVTKS
jgi:proteasome lid subunit RPN8/RPN11